METVDYRDKISKSKDLKSLWNQLLGEENLNDVYQGKYDDVLNEDKYSISENQEKEFDYCIKTGIKQECGEGIFTQFTVFFERIAGYVQYIATNILSEKEGYSENLILSMVIQVTKRLVWTCMRCLVQEMHQHDVDGMLRGHNAGERYQEFNSRYLDEERYLLEFFQKYRFLKIIIIRKAVSYVEAAVKLLEHLLEDKKDIIEKICEKKTFNRIIDWKLGLSDEHIPGETVCCIKLDNGISLYYKPHNLDCAVYYEYISDKFFKLCGVKKKEHQILNRKTYGWERKVIQETCTTEKEVREYYKSFGVQIFLCYILGMTDLHGENIIASGQYPILIDVEFIADASLHAGNRDNLLKDCYKDTVLNSGLIPGKEWLGQKVDVAGIGGVGIQKMNILIPTVINERTSDMKIVYMHPKIQNESNLPLLRGKSIGYEAYISYLIDGFIIAYDKAMLNRSMFEDMCLKGIPEKSRFLLRNTQEYFMYINSMNFPMFMTSPYIRHLMLLHMAKSLKCYEKWYHEILKYEMDCIYKEIYPIYYVKGKDLIAGDGQYFTNYFKDDRKIQIKKRIDKMSEWDRDFQIRLMKISFLKQKDKKREERDKLCVTKTEKLTPEKIGEILVKRAYKTESIYEWDGIRYDSSGCVMSAPVDMYFYNGISGIAVYLAALYKKNRNPVYKNILEGVTKQLFRYTEKKIIQGNNMGLYTGECSLILTYLSLGKILNEDKEKMNAFAEKQAIKIIPLLDDVKENDLLSGKAGIIVAMTMLYEVTDVKKYLNIAIHVAEKLMKTAVKQEKGIAWPEEEQRALAGMAHGNSGIAVAFAWLYHFTGDEKYKQIITEAIQYEDTLYSAELNNWFDMRSESRKDTIGWCHGSPGILLSRLKIRQMTNLSEKKIWTFSERKVYKDIVKQISDKIFQNKKMDMCLCHGQAGIMWILEDIDDNFKNLKIVDREIKGRLSEKNILNPGFMMGLSGIGYWMLRKEDSELPNLLM